MFLNSKMQCNNHGAMAWDCRRGWRNVKYLVVGTSELAGALGRVFCPVTDFSFLAEIFLMSEEGLSRN